MHGCFNGPNIVRVRVKRQITLRDYMWTKRLKYRHTTSITAYQHYLSNTLHACKSRGIRRNATILNYQTPSMDADGLRLGMRSATSQADHNGIQAP